MKNFTKQNFKTNPLWIRLIIMAFMLLAGAGNVWAATITSDGNSRLYFNSTAVSWWPAGNNCDGNFAYFFNNSTGKSAWSAHAVKDDYNEIYYFVIPSGTWAGVVLTRNNTSTAPSWDNRWNQTGDITLSSSSNYLTSFSDGSTTSKWGDCVGIPGVTIQDVSPICSGSTATLSASCNQGYTKINWYDVETGGTSLKEGASYTTAALTSNKTYYASATNGMCTTPRGSVSVTVRATPTKYTVSKGSADNIVKLSNSQTNYTYTLYKDGVAVSNSNKAGKTGSELEWTLSEDGTYTVKARYTGSTCTLTQMTGSYEYISCTDPKASNFTYTAPENLTYNNETKAATVVWNGTQGGDITVKYSSTSNKYTAATPKDAGTYYVFVSTVENENYCAVTDLYINTFTIAPAEQTDFSITNSSYTVCGKSVTVTAAGGQSDGAITYSITTDNTSTKDASIDVNTGVLTVKSAGTVSVQAKRAATTNYKEITDNVTFTFTMPIENVKLAVKSTSAKESYCKNDVITLVLTYDGPTPNYDAEEFKWVLDGIQSGTEFIGGGSNGIKSGSEFQLKLAGIGINKVGVKLKGCNGWVQSTDENSVNVTVNALPYAPGLKTASSITVCPGNLTLANYVNVASGTTVLWFTDEDCTQYANSPSIAAGETKVFYAKAKNTSTGCLSAGKTTLTITAYSAPADFTLTAIPTEICSGADVVISISNKQDGVTYKLGDTEINESITVNPTETTTYTVVASLDACSNLTTSITTAEITVNPIPSFTGVPQNLPLCKGATDVTDLTELSHVVVKNGDPVWYDAETAGNEVTEGADLIYGGTYWVAAENSETGCVNPERKQFVLTINNLPDTPILGNESASLCQSNEKADLDKLADVDAVVWYLNDEEVEKPDQVSIATAGEFRYLAKAVDPITGCVSADGVEFTLTVNPLPTIALTADNDALSVGETVTLTVTGNDFTSLTWSATDGTKSYTVTPGAGNTATITSNENAIVTVTVIATSANGCVATATKELTFGSEDCENANADYIEILCRRTDNPASTDAGRDMHCYAWDPNTDKTYLGGWPGVKTDDGDFEYKGKKYAVWQIKTNSDIYIIFSNGNDSQKTGDIKGPNDAGLKKGYRYVYTLSSDYKTATLYEDPSIIFAPEVKTLSATCARQSDNSLKVTVTGKIMKKGCARISSYGFQYKKDGGDYTNVDVCSSNCDQDAGFIFTKDITLAAGKYGEYTFRARLINENSSKVYGEKITIYYSESDVLIAAVGDDEEVTNKSGVYYDFVGLYVKNVMLPEGAKVKFYQWYKGDAVYNGGNVTVADRGVSAANNNIRPSEAGLYKCVVTLDNNQTLTSNVINVTATDTYNDKVNASNRNLPVISVRTNVAFPTCATAGTEGKYPSTNIEGWKEKRSVDVKIFNANGTLYYDRKARMNYRGSSSLNFNKKSYAFCPGAANCGGKNGADYVKKEALNLFGLSGGAIDEDWVLYAAAADPTLMRNRLVFDTYAKMTGEWGVNSMFVELVIDGEYQGVYVLMDKITNNEKRVYVGTYGDDEKKDYNGGFIVKFDKTDVADRERNLVAGQEIGDEKTFMTTRTGRLNIDTYNTKVDQLFEIEYPEKGDVEDAKGNWSTVLGSIKQKFQDFENALEKGEFLKVRAMIDYESWADWFIINEFTKNVDAYRASCVFTCEGEGHKIKAMPLWDQELSFNNEAGANISKKGANVTNGLLIENSGVYTDCFPAPFWFTGRTSNFNTCGTDGGESTEGQRLEYYLLKDECFIQTIKERWKKHIAEDGALHNETLTTKVDALLTELGKAKSRETTKWPSDHRVADACGGPGTGYNKVTFDDSKEALDDWVGGELNADATSESSSNSRVTNLNYLINQMQGDPLQFNLVLNPGNGVTTPWVPVTLTVEAPAGYDYTYDDSEVEAAEGVIIKKLGSDAYSYTFPRPEAWGTGNDANASDPRDPRQYGVKVTLNVETVDNTCGTVDTEKHATITLEDEGDDNCSYTDK